MFLNTRLFFCSTLRTYLTLSTVPIFCTGITWTVGLIPLDSAGCCYSLLCASLAGPAPTAGPGHQCS